MKKTLTIIALAGVLLSCTKEERLASVSFTCRYVESGTLVRSTESVNQIITDNQPSGINLQLRSERTGRVYKSAITGTLLLPVGNYSVTGENVPQKTGIIFGSGNYFSSTPKVIVQESINVSAGVTEYPLSAQIRSFAISCDFREVERMTFYNENADEEPVPFIINDSTGLAFVYGDYRQRPLRVVVYPKDTEHNEPVKFNLCYEPVSDGVLVQRGRYYIFHPHAVETGNAGFGITLPNWEGVEVK